jgi:hypothetical protein
MDSADQILDRLADLADVDVSGIANGQFLRWDGTAKQFVGDDPPSGGSAVTSVAGRTGAITLAEADIAGLGDDLSAKADASALGSHVANTSNPHGVTKAQVGLGSVDNTADADKPVSTAQQTALDGKAPTVHNHTASQITDLAVWLAAHLVAGSNLTLTTDPGTGEITIAASGGGGGGGSPGGSDGAIQLNDAGAFGGDANLTFSSNTLRVKANPGQTTPAIVVLDPSGTAIGAIHADGRATFGDASAKLGAFTLVGDVPGGRAAGLALVNKGSGANAAISLDFYTVLGTPTPQARILCQDASGYTDDLVILIVPPGQGDQPLMQERMRLISHGGMVITPDESLTTERVLFRGKNNAATSAIDLAGGFSPPQITDATALSNSLYYSTTAGKLAFKDPSGTVHTLY